MSTLRPTRLPVDITARLKEWCLRSQAQNKARMRKRAHLSSSRSTFCHHGSRQHQTQTRKAFGMIYAMGFATCISLAKYRNYVDSLLRFTPSSARFSKPKGPGYRLVAKTRFPTIVSGDVSYRLLWLGRMNIVHNRTLCKGVTNVE